MLESIGVLKEIDDSIMLVVSHDGYDEQNALYPLDLESTRLSRSRSIVVVWSTSCALTMLRVMTPQ